jgi:hypothetical protein
MTVLLATRDGKPVAFCNVCDKSIPLPLPCGISDLVDLLRVFINNHKACRPPTWQDVVEATKNPR